MVLVAFPFIPQNVGVEGNRSPPRYQTVRNTRAVATRMMGSISQPLESTAKALRTIVPGWIMTERQKTVWATPEALERHRQKQCLPDLIEPVYVARMALFLASDDAAMCTANNYMVEAGSI